MSGLDKAERLKKEREEKEPEPEEAARLEPPFPYEMERFDPVFFGLPEPPKKK